MPARPSAANGNRVELVTARGRDRPQGGMPQLRDVMQRLRASILRCTIALDAAIVEGRPPGVSRSLPPRCSKLRLMDWRQMPARINPPLRESLEARVELRVYRKTRTNMAIGITHH